jgi:MoaA/NifB/PqqE/SkfB family radical SAM enzyme
MSLDIFRKIVPVFKNTGLVYLQGWGEPLLNENIFQMIEFCKMKDKPVGFTTNGLLLNKKIISTLIDLKLDILCVSLAGTNSATHNRLRKGNNFDQIISNLTLLRELKKKKGESKPALHLAYLMIKSNFDEIKNIISLARTLNAKQVIASNLTLIIKKDLCGEALFNDIPNIEYYSAVLKQIKEEALIEDIIFEYRNPVLNQSFQPCSENTNYSSVIDVEGNVSPCVFTMPSLYRNIECNDNKIPVHYFKDEVCQGYKTHFGNIVYESFDEIWKKRYTDFRNFTSKPSKIANNSSRSDLVECCAKCYKSLSV